MDPSTGQSLRISDLEIILDTLTLHPEVGRPTVITPDHGLNTYVHDVDPMKAYQLLTARTDVADDIWTNYSPCQFCAKALIRHFEKLNDKPTVHVGRIYVENNSLEDTIDTLHCLGKMQHLGFKIVAWDFNAFKSTLTEPCQTLITEHTKETHFMNEYSKLERQVKFIHKLGRIPDASTWCK